MPKDLKKWVIISFWSNRIQRPLSFRRTIFFFVSICLTFFHTSTKDHSSSSSSGHPSCLSLTPNPKLRFLSFSLCDLCSHLYLIFIFLFYFCLVSRKFLYFLCFLLLTNHIQLKKLEKKRLRIKIVENESVLSCDGFLLQFSSQSRHLPQWYHLSATINFLRVSFFLTFFVSRIIWNYAYLCFN